MLYVFHLVSRIVFVPLTKLLLFKGVAILSRMVES